jgi:ABC-type nitrate/sulfonate/bicarbonate transport system ATPase subunit
MLGKTSRMIRDDDGSAIRGDEGSPAALEAEGIVKAYRAGASLVSVIDFLSLRVEKRSWVTCLGPSGCGKTTLLRILSGLIEPDEGTIWVRGTDRTRLGVTAFLPQHDTLLPWRTALENAILAVELAGYSRAGALGEARKLFGQFGLSGFEAHHPGQLSGGMRQRVSLIRTFLARREILLLDEPLGALDPLTRTSLQDWLLTVWSELRKTILLVTHDVEEALVLSDRVLVLSSRPATVRTRIDLQDLGRPRKRFDEAFLRRRAEILSLLLEEVEV